MKSHLYLYTAALLALCAGGPAFLRCIQAHAEALGTPVQVVLLLAYAWACIIAAFLMTVELEAFLSKRDKDNWKI